MLEKFWRVYAKEKTLNEDSLKKETYRFNSHIKDYWQDFDFSKLKHSDLINYKNHLSDKNLAPKSIKHCLSLLRAILNRAIQHDLHHSILPQFPKMRFDNRRERFLSKDEAYLLLDILKKKSQLWHDITCFSLHTGMRASEIFKLKTEDVRLDSMQIVLYDTKNHFSRVLPLNGIAFKIVRTYMLIEREFLFFDKPPRDVSCHFKTAVKKAGLNDKVTDRRNKVVFHTLRHTFASWLIQDGVEITVVSRLLGHRSLEMTMRYAHLAPNQGMEAVTRLQRKFEE